MITILVGAVIMGLFDSIKRASSFKEAIRLIKKGDEASDVEGRRIMLELAELRRKGDPKVSMWMAKEYEDNGCYGAAAEWYEIAADQGVLEAKEGYKRCYNPYNIDSDYDISHKWERGCGTPRLRYVTERKESIREEYNRAMGILEGDPAPKEVNESLNTITLIASAHPCVVPEAQMFLGDFYESFIGDLEKAASWYKKAAENNNAEGARCYADMLYYGRGVKKNEEDAIKYYTIAAEKGQPDSLCVIGQLYYKKGEIEKAKEYLQKAVEAGLNVAKEMFDNIVAGRDIYEKPKFRSILEDAFSDAVINHDLSNDGIVEYYSDIYEPEDFCHSVYEYCNEHFAEIGKDKLLFEYNMTSFYGAICSVALWDKDKAAFANNSAWDVICNKIDVNAVDAHAESFLNTSNGEEKAESVFDIIQGFMGISIPTMDLYGEALDVCMFSIELAYKLGLLVAKKELGIHSYNFVREVIATHEEEQLEQKEDYKDDEFYNQCLKEFHAKAKELGVAKQGVILVPELIPYGEKTILTALQEPYFQSVFANDPEQYYLFIMAMSIDAGIIYATKWHKDYQSLDSYVEDILERGPADDADVIMERWLPYGLFHDQGRPFFSKIFPVWLKLHEPYWKLKDPREYTFKLMLAAYQLGISIILDKYE